MKQLLIMVCALFLSFTGYAQTAAIKTETHTFKLVDGRIAVKLLVNGIEGDFLLDLAGNTAILPEFAEKIGMKDLKPTAVYDFLPYRKLEASQKGNLATVALDNNVYGNTVSALLLKGTSADNIRKLGVAGVVGGSLFKNVTLTIDKKNGKIYTSTPFKPSFIHLADRTDCTLLPGGIPQFEMKLAGQPVKVVFDTWQTGLLSLPSDKALPANKQQLPKNITIDGVGFGSPVAAQQTFKVSSVSLVNVNMANQAVAVSSALAGAVAGLKLLDYGLLSIDFQKGKAYFQTYQSTVITEEAKVALIQPQSGKANAITKDEFIEYIFDYRNNKDFVLKGDKPVVVDFWATWCGPCMKLMPVMEKLAEKYKDQVVFYKINADKEKELCSRFNITALPYIMLIKPGKAPIIEVGDQPAKIMGIIEEKLLK